MRAFAFIVLLLVALSFASAFEGDYVQTYDSEVYPGKTRYVQHLANAASAAPSTSGETAPPRFAEVIKTSTPEPAAASAGPANAKHCGDRELDCDSPDVVKSDEERNSKMASVDHDGKKEEELDAALQNTKDSIVQKATQIKSEKKWVKEVMAVIQSYAHKVKRVNKNIREMQQGVKELFRKKKQIENLIMQRKLELKLKVANTDLTTLKSALDNVKRKESAFVKSKKDVRGTIGAIEDQLRKLRGEPEEDTDKDEKDKDKKAEDDEKAKSEEK